MSRYSDYKHASDILQKIESNPEKYLIIHYSCESFYNLEGRSPRIASISVRQFNNAQTTNFSIHQYSEILNMPITTENYKVIEKSLLEDFFTFVDRKMEKTWIHWNMRDTVFGFHAIEQRFRILGGTPIIIDDDKKIDLAYLFKKKYGDGYIDNPHIEKLLKLNQLTPYRFLTGKEEAEAFDSGHYHELSMSTSSKVNGFSTFLTLAINDDLKTNIPKWKIRGTNLSGLSSAFLSTFWGKFILWMLNLFVGGIIGALISKYF
ncbi:hypothetical protein [Streptococcus pluranimalium]|uniref:hypothetical protein n=1 Tax=Streptococcus pluranimalium TaxID=82348 RepID=UPI003F68E9B7